LWDVATHQFIGLPLTSHAGKISAVAISPDGRTLASGGTDGNLILWDATTRRALGLPLKTQTTVYALAISPDGTRLASGRFVASNSEAAGLTVWDVSPEAWQASACQIAGRNFTRAEWAEYFPGEAYNKTCEGLP